MDTNTHRTGTAYTPTDNEVQAGYLNDIRKNVWLNRTHSKKDYADEFDRWLAERDAEVRRELLLWLDERLDAEQLDMAAEHFDVDITWSSRSGDCVES